MKVSIYDFVVQDIEGNKINLSDYQGKALLIVNTATGCGLTPQYEGLQMLYDKYNGKGFEILDFPCNQFLKQAPGTNEEVNVICKFDYGTTFPRFSKINVNGKNANPLYVWLKSQKGGTLGSSIKWNFTKFLVSPDGKVVGRYGPTTKPEAIENEIEKLMTS